MAIAKLLMHKGGNPEKARILVLARTGFAAVNISGATIQTVHSGLGINVGSKMFPMNDRQCASLRNKLSEARFLITDEISMVFSMLFYQVNQRLNEIFGCPDSACFGGIPVFVCSDFSYFPPVKGSPLYSASSSIKSILSLDLRIRFKMVEFTEVVRQ